MAKVIHGEVKLKNEYMEMSDLVSILVSNGYVVEVQQVNEHIVIVIMTEAK